ncbi:MAG: leucine-rich repeat protein [Bacteroidales bacterium]|nr:leucine-rich repeat protein [Bacteroidales bacterium]
MKRVKLRLLLWAVLLLTGWTSASATEFIKADFCYSWDDAQDWAINKVKESGFDHRLDYDFNAGCGTKSGYIYIGYTTTTNPAEACTDIMFVVRGDAYSPDKMYYNGKTYKVLKKGWNGGNSSTDWDFNNHAKGQYIFMYYTSDGNTEPGAELITELSANTTSNGFTYAKQFTGFDSNNNATGVGGSANLNEGAGGNTCYLSIKKGHKHGSDYRAISPFQHEHYCASCGHIYGKENHNFVNGVCTKCGYNEATAPLTFIAKTAGSTVRLHTKDTPYSADMQYTRDYVTWSTYSIGSTVKLNKVNDFVAFRSSATRTQFSKDNDNYYHYQLTGSVAATGTVMTLFSPKGTRTTVSQYALNKLFYNQTALISAPYLPATSLGSNCYESMFEGCTGLTSARTLPATTLSSNCYKGMFKGCTNLTSAPELKATTLAQNCCTSMFEGCIKLTNAPELKATTLASNCYEGMFKGCIKLTSAPALPANTMKSYCYYNMFNGCTSLTNAPTLSAASLAENCYESMFEGCTSLVYAPALSAYTLASGCYLSMFKGCQKLKQCPTLRATSLATDCYHSMFEGCIALTNASELPATELKENCYDSMFRNCTGLTSAPYMPATTLVTGCYNNMFEGCSNLSKVRAYFGSWVNGATTDWLKEVAQNGHFYSTPTLPLTRGTSYIPEGWDAPECDYLRFTANVANSTISISQEDDYWELEYSRDGINWTNYETDEVITLSEAGDQVFLRNKTVVEDYLEVEESSHIEEHHHIHLTGSVAASGNIMYLLDHDGEKRTVSYEGFYGLFQGESALTSAPTLTATTLGIDAYAYMFFECPNLHEVEVAFSAWPENATKQWLTGAASQGTFICPPSLPRTRGEHYIPEGWNVPEYLTLTAKKAGATVRLHKSGSPADISLQYSTDGVNWKGYTIDESITLANVNDYVCFRATSTNSRFSTGDWHYYIFELGDSIAASGNVMSLLDKTCQQTSVPERAFCKLFMNQPKLTSAPSLPATSLAYSCYSNMFEGCTGLTAVPALPATSLAYGCYSNMFKGCTGLTAVPALPATSLADYCYSNMFEGCSNLNEVNVAFTSWSNSATTNWLNGVASTGTFTCPSSLPRNRGIDYIPEGWDAPEYLTLTAQKAGATVQLTKNGSPASVSLQYSTRYSNWSDYAIGSTITLADSADYVRFRATSTNSRFSTIANNYYMFVLGDSIAASGNVMSLLDKTCKKTSVAEYAFYNLFGGQTSLTQAPELPATTLSNSCYSHMFYGCTGLINAPVLPAKTLAGNCYEGMFAYCIGLTQAPELPATTMAINCYYEMFSGCTRLTNAPDLPATTLAENCYEEMFTDCTHLINAPELPATTLAIGCYANMFQGCTNLTQAPVLPAATLTEYCYENMFQDCTNLTQTPVLHAATLTESCYNKMFSGCINLNKVIVNFSDAKYFNLNAEEADATIGCSDFEANSPTFEWLADVASTGTFVCPSTMDVTKLYRGSNNIPSGWTVEPFLTEVTLNSKGYATYSASVNMVTDEEEKAFACKVEGDEIHCTAIDSIPAGTGALLVGDAGETIRLHMVLDAPAVADNDLRATTSSSLYVERIPKEGFNYVLNGSKFLRYTGATFAANKAYFNLPAVVAAGAAELRLVFDDLIAEEDETTSINSISTDDADQTPAFSLQGQRVTTDAKGLQVRNGHVIFKK